MDEEAIQNELKAKIEPTSDEPSGPVGDSPSAGTVEEGITLDMYKTMDHFELDASERHNQTNIDQLNYILTHAKANTENGDLLDALNYIREMEARLGLRFKGNRLYHLYHWIRLDQEARQIEAEKLGHVA